MVSNDHIWRVWVRNLHRWGLQDITAAFLEATGPLLILGAQLVYIGQPFFKGWTSSDNIQAIANILEDTEQRQAFISLLREEPASELL